MGDDPKPAETITTVKTETLPKPFWQGVLEDLHVNASGFVMFGCGACAIFIPSHKEQFEDLAALAGTYLFASAKNKSNDK